MNKQLNDFFDNTKQLHILLSITLFLLIVIMVAPIGIGYFRNIGQIIVIGILSYILYKNLSETHSLSNTINNKVNEKNDSDNGFNNDIKSNIIASYILCVFVFLLLLYVMYLMF
jgi:hypothetical protein